MISGVICVIFLILLTNCPNVTSNSTLMNLGCQEQQAVLGAGNTTGPRNLVMMPAIREMSNGSGERERLSELTDTEQKNYLHTMGHIRQGVLRYTACNVSSPSHVHTSCSEIQSLLTT